MLSLRLPKKVRLVLTLVLRLSRWNLGILLEITGSSADAPFLHSQTHYAKGTGCASHRKP